MKKQKVKKRQSGLPPKVLWAEPITDRFRLNLLKGLSWDLNADHSCYKRAVALAKFLEAFGLTRRRCTYEQASIMVRRLLDASNKLIEHENSNE
jgi:hypothetical protein